jgi:hypothetical protein
MENIDKLKRTRHHLVKAVEKADSKIYYYKTAENTQPFEYMDAINEWETEMKRLSEKLVEFDKRHPNLEV